MGSTEAEEAPSQANWSKGGAAEPLGSSQSTHSQVIGLIDWLPGSLWAPTSPGSPLFTSSPPAALWGLLNPSAEVIPAVLEWGRQRCSFPSLHQLNRTWIKSHLAVHPTVAWLTPYFHRKTGSGFFWFTVACRKLHWLPTTFDLLSCTWHACLCLPPPYNPTFYFRNCSCSAQEGKKIMVLFSQGERWSLFFVFTYC